MSGGPGVNGDLGAGYRGVGSLAIRDGVTVNSASGYLGYCTARSAPPRWTAKRSTWANDSYLYVGYSGKGTLAVTNCATVSDSYAYVGYNSGSTGGVTVNGLGSSWGSYQLMVGYYGNGTVT